MRKIITTGIGLLAPSRARPISAAARGFKGAGHQGADRSVELDGRLYRRQCRPIAGAGRGTDVQVNQQHPPPPLLHTTNVEQDLRGGRSAAARSASNWAIRIFGWAASKADVQATRAKRQRRLHLVQAGVCNTAAAVPAAVPGLVTGTIDQKLVVVRNPARPARRGRVDAERPRLCHQRRSRRLDHHRRRTIRLRSRWKQRCRTGSAPTTTPRRQAGRR